ncbi:hypothetical protein BC830DRAFT_904509 [Chytriomyces sp. MP71]|nr:hypothetical protein BC830DRAFT_904509 [Chytriomyces sp. MP71]
MSSRTTFSPVQPASTLQALTTFLSPPPQLQFTTSATSSIPAPQQPSRLSEASLTILFILTAVTLLVLLTTLASLCLSWHRHRLRQNDQAIARKVSSDVTRRDAHPAAPPRPPFTLPAAAEAFAAGFRDDFWEEDADVRDEVEYVDAVGNLRDVFGASGAAIKEVEGILELERVVRLHAARRTDLGGGLADHVKLEEKEEKKMLL